MKLEPNIDTLCLATWFIVPIIFGIWWIRMKLGIDKRWFVIPARVLISRGFYFALPTFVIGSAIFFLGAISPTLDPNGNLMLIGLGFLPLGFVLAFLEPDWLSPAWYRWLKQEHGDIMPYLVMDAHEMGRQAWLERVATQEDLEEWAEAVRRRYGR